MLPTSVKHADELEHNRNLAAAADQESPLETSHPRSPIKNLGFTLLASLCQPVRAAVLYDLKRSEAPAAQVAAATRAIAHCCSREPVDAC